MPSPFPGMDPYLETEALWPAFQHQLVLCLYQILLPGLVDRYRARVAQRPVHSQVDARLRPRVSRRGMQRLADERWRGRCAAYKGGARVIGEAEQGRRVANRTGHTRHQGWGGVKIHAP